MTKVPFPTDYGPDTASDFAKTFRLPPAKRPPMREILSLLKRTPARPRPPVPLIDEWMKIPPTSLTSYITGGAALNIPDPRGGGDWHDAWHYSRRSDDPARIAMRSTDDDANPVLAHVLTNVLGPERIIDARPRLARKGHPEAKPEGPPIWAASHERATVERVLRRAIGSPCPPAPDQPERILDRRTVYRWLATEEQLKWVEATILGVAEHLPPQRADPIRGWVAHVVHNQKPTE